MSLFTRTSPVDHASIEGQLSGVQLIEGKNLRQGWALKKSKKSKRFLIKVKWYLIDKFQVGQTTGNKIDPLQVSVDMRCARDEDGKRMFSSLNICRHNKSAAHFQQWQQQNGKELSVQLQ